MQILAADVGGTKTLIGVFSHSPGRPRLLASERVDTRADVSFESLVRPLIDAYGPPEGVALGVAGPIVGTTARLTNGAWGVDTTHLSRALGAPVWLLNDVEALAYALDVLTPDDVVTVQAGHPQPDGPMAVVAPGTGLGEAHLLRAGGRPVVCASESGHADFAPRNAVEDRVVTLLRARAGRATVEHVLSGPGLLTLHEVAHEQHVCGVTAGALESDLPAITRAGLDGTCHGCAETLALFASALGSEAGNLALRTLATGGVFVGGGIPPRMLPVLRTTAFLDAFRRKPPMTALLERIPLHLLTFDGAALLGAAVVAARRLQ